MSLRIERVTVDYLPVEGVVVAVPTIPEDAPPHLREGLARIRVTGLTGTCPCGARLTAPNRAQRREMRRDHRARQDAAWGVQVSHEPDCPAVAPEVTAAYERAGGGFA